MNLLSLVDWRAVNREERLPDGNFAAPQVLDLLSRMTERDDIRTIHPITDFSLGDDLRIEEGVSEGMLWVGSEASREGLRDAPPLRERPDTWREVIPLDDGRSLSIPGEQLHQSTISFWRPGQQFDSRAAVISLIVRSDRITGLAWWRRNSAPRH